MFDSLKPASKSRVIKIKKELSEQIKNVQEKLLNEINRSNINDSIKQNFFYMFKFYNEIVKDHRDEGFSRRFVLFRYRYLDMKSRAVVNIGDYVQTLAVKKGLERLFEKPQFIYHDRDYLSTYDDLTSVVIMQGWFAYGFKFFPSKRLIPVYIGFHLTPSRYSDFLNFVSVNSSYFKDMVIGCRDKHTQQFLDKIGIKTYLSRCLTLTFSRREQLATQNKVFIVNVPDRLRKFIPDYLLKDAVFINQRYVDRNLSNADYFNRENEYLNEADKLLERYKKEARLVITTALHCASPCTAMGIPVVLIDPFENNARFDFLEDIIQIYKIDNLKKSQVNWNPVAPDIENLKSDIIENLSLSIKEILGENVDRSKLDDIRNRISSYKLK